VLVDFDPAAPLRTLAAGWRGRVHHVAAVARDPLGLAALLVRPDGIVAWACDDRSAAAGAAHALARWFGAPVAP